MSLSGYGSAWKSAQLIMPTEFREATWVRFGLGNRVSLNETIDSAQTPQSNLMDPKQHFTPLPVNTAPAVPITETTLPSTTDPPNQPQKTAPAPTSAAPDADRTQPSSSDSGLVQFNSLSTFNMLNTSSVNFYSSIGSSSTISAGAFNQTPLDETTGHAEKTKTNPAIFVAAGVVGGIFTTLVLVFFVRHQRRKGQAYRAFGSESAKVDPWTLEPPSPSLPPLPLEKEGPEDIELQTTVRATDRWSRLSDNFGCGLP
jgi:hypothetical protein